MEQNRRQIYGTIGEDENIRFLIVDGGIIYNRRTLPRTRIAMSMTVRQLIEIANEINAAGINMRKMDIINSIYHRLSIIGHTFNIGDIQQSVQLIHNNNILGKK